MRTRTGLILLALTPMLFTSCSGPDTDNDSDTGGASAAGNPSTGAAANQNNTTTESALLTEVTEQLGLTFVHEPMTEDYFFMPEMTAPGCAIFDYDNDGDLDIYLVNSALGPDSPATGRPVNRLFSQNDAGTFDDVTDESGLGDESYGIGIALGDFDNDGDLDVYLTNLHRDRLYRNNGDGTFTDVTESAGITNDHWSCSAAFLDYNRDGFLDLYVVNYVAVTPGKICSDASGLQDFCGPQVFPGITDVLYHNNGDGTFSDVTAAAGLTTRAGKGLGIVCRDFDRNGWIDVYVANDGEPNQLWLNTEGRFVDVAFEMGAAVNEYGEPEASMGLAVGDVDNDGDEDVFMTHLASESNTLFTNDGHAIFSDATARSNLATTSTPFTGFGTCFVDIDHDRDLDLLIVNGRVKRGATPYPGGTCGEFWNGYAEPNQFFLNRGRGRFEDATDRTGSFGREIEVSRGMAWGDIDRDGDIDFLITNCKGPARLYRNDAPRDKHWLIIRAIDPDLNRDAFGAQVSITTASGTLIRTVHADGSYASSSDPSVHFGLGGDDHIEQLSITWPDGMVEHYGEVQQVDRYIVVHKGVAEVSDG